MIAALAPDQRPAKCPRMGAPVPALALFALLAHKFPPSPSAPSASLRYNLGPSEAFKFRPSTFDRFISSQLYYFQTITNSLGFLETLTPVFSSKSELFCRNTRGGVSPKKRSFRISNFQTLASRPSCNLVNPLRRSASHASPFVFRLLQNPCSATPFLSHPYKTPGGCGVHA
jgi:hypothetical protein